jgi:hypothetical protein
MITWQATIKELGNDHLLTPTYTIPDDMFCYIKDYHVRDLAIRKHLRKFWGLNNPYVEWYKLEKV